MNISSVVQVTNTLFWLESASYTPGLLIVVLGYSATVADVTLSVNFVPTTTLFNTFALQASQLDILIHPDNAPAIFYHSDVYLQCKTVMFVVLVCSGVALLLFVVGHCFRGLLAVELIGTLQMAFFAVSLGDSVSPAMAAYAQLGMLANGYNFHPEETTSKAPQLQAMDVSSFFLWNCNIMLIAEMVVVLLGGVFRHVDRTLGPKRSLSRLYRTAGFMLSELLLVWVLFNMLNISFSIGLNIRTAFFQDYSSISHAGNIGVMVLGLLLIVLVLYCIFQRFPYS